MSDFSAVINAILNPGNVESKINELIRDREVQITPVVNSGKASIDKVMNQQFSNIQKSAKNTTRYINKNLTGTKYKSGDFSLSTEFVKQQRKMQTEHEKVAEQIVKDTKATQAQANQIIKKGTSEQAKYQRQRATEIKKQLEKADKISQSYANKEYSSKTNSNKLKLDGYVSNNSKEYKDASASINEEIKSLEQLQEAKNNYYNDKSYANATKLVKAEESYSNALKTSQSNLKILSGTSGQRATEKQLQSLQGQMDKYSKANPRAYKAMQTSFDNMQSSIKAGTVTAQQYKDMQTSFSRMKSSASNRGLEGNNLFGEIGRGFKQIGQFALTYGALQSGISKISESIVEIKDIDTILTEISKTSDRTPEQLQKLGQQSYDRASKYGKKASDYLLGVQEMNRSGYYGEKGNQMADLSVLTQAAGDVDAETANSYLLAANAAYKYKGSVEKLNAVLDGQNSITNRNSVSMQDMAEATGKAGSMAAEMGVKENELSALIGVTESRTKSGGNEAGNSLKSLFINLQNTGNSKIVSTLEKAGVSMTKIENGAQKLRTPIEILNDLQKVFKTLDQDDPLRSEILTNIGQKYHANKLSAILTGWSDYEKMLKDYSEGEGSAQSEAEKSANNLEGSLNKLSNTWTGVVNSFANSQGLTSAVKVLSSLLSVVKDITTTLGSSGTIASAIGAFLSVKDLGENKYYTNYSIAVLR